MPRTAMIRPSRSQFLPSLLFSFLACVASSSLPSRVQAQHDVGISGYSPEIQAASNEGEQAISRFRIPEGMKLSLYAAEPQLAHPVAFSFDPKGRLYVVETFRHSAGVTDTRGHMNWLDDDLACRTVEDRVAMYRKYFSSEEFAAFSKEQDRIRLIEDRDGDGRADYDTVFADGFNRPETGLGAGVLPWKDGVFFTCIPDLWWLKDTKGTGQADQRKALHQGYGVHVAFLGHDLHGLIMGPDGRLYFSIGDRGLNVTTVDGKHLELTDMGAVLRCEPDGTNLEIFHQGLRNPQELAFDEQGNLFTVDNNSDGGDKARLVHLVPGGDSGWRIGWQFIEQPNSRGPWNSEKMWEPRNDSQPAYLLPPLLNMADGPSGLAYNPGTALREKDRGRFFLADFRGSSSASGIRSFSLRPVGASFELSDQDQFLWGMCVTDVGFGPDGSLYMTDWVEGWNTSGKGRVYRLDTPEATQTPGRVDVKKLLASGFAQLPGERLGELLNHDDYRIRLAAQYELAERAGNVLAAGKPQTLASIQAEPSLNELLKPLFSDTAPIRVRRHAVWAVGQVARKYPQILSWLTEPWLAAGQKGDPDFRIQLARTLTDLLRANPALVSVPKLSDALMAGVQDQDSKVRFWSALGLGALGTDAAGVQLVKVLAENDDKDLYLRHGAVMGLAGLGARLPQVMRAPGAAASPAVRMGSLLALRRQSSPDVAAFLADAEPKIVLEAARAIHDVPISSAFPQLAALELAPQAPAPLARRVLNANVVLGDEQAAGRLARLAARTDVDDAVRAEAIDALAAWSKPSGRDRVVGLWRPLAERSPGSAARELAKVGAPLLQSGPESVAQSVARAIGSLKLAESEPALIQVATADDKPVAVRNAALRALAELKTGNVLTTVKQVAQSSSAEVRSTAIDILAAESPADAIPALQLILDSGATTEKQKALDTLAKVNGSEAGDLLASWLDRLKQGEVPAELRLELMEAAANRADVQVKEKLAAIQAAYPTDDPLATYRDCLSGGSTQAGSQVFYGKSEVYCQRCHKVNGNGGEVGPDLTDIGKKKDREYLLQSIVLPNHAIAEGFETRVLALNDGTIVAGIVKKDDGKLITLMTPEAKTIEVDRARVEEERRGDSAMPADLVTKMSRRELRDLVEFLATGR